MLRWVVLSVLCCIAAGDSIPSEGNRTLSLLASPMKKGPGGATAGNVWENGSIIRTQRCSSIFSCYDGTHCCSRNTCCQNYLSCCGGGQFCCTSGSSSVKSILGLTATALLLLVGRIL